MDFPFINKTYVAVVRMKNEIYFGPNSKYVKVFVLVLSPLNEVRLRLGTVLLMNNHSLVIETN